MMMMMIMIMMMMTMMIVIDDGDDGGDDDDDDDDDADDDGVIWEQSTLRRSALNMKPSLKSLAGLLNMSKGNTAPPSSSLLACRDRKAKAMPRLTVAIHPTLFYNVR